MTVAVTDVAGKQQEIIERRATLLGETIEHPDKSITEIIKDLAVQLKCSPDILWKDWANQDEWISDVFKLNTAYANKCVMFNENIKRLGMIAWRTGDNSNACVGGLRVAKEANKEILDLCQKIGVFDHVEHTPSEVRLGWQLPEGFIDFDEYLEFEAWKKKQNNQDEVVENDD